MKRNMKNVSLFEITLISSELVYGCICVQLNNL